MDCTHPESRGPSQAMMEDGDYRRVCTVCLRRFTPEPAPEPDPDAPSPEPEVFSWDVYQPVF